MVNDHETSCTTVYLRRLPNNSGGASRSYSHSKNVLLRLGFHFLRIGPLMRTEAAFNKRETGGQIRSVPTANPSIVRTCRTAKITQAAGSETIATRPPYGLEIRTRSWHFGQRTAPVIPASTSRAVESKSSAHMGQ